MVMPSSSSFSYGIGGQFGAEVWLAVAVALGLAVVIGAVIAIERRLGAARPPGPGGGTDDFVDLHGFEPRDVLPAVEAYLEATVSA